MSLSIIRPILRFKDGAWFQHLNRMPYPLGDLYAILTFTWTELHTLHLTERALTHLLFGMGSRFANKLHHFLVEDLHESAFYANVDV